MNKQNTTNATCGSKSRSVLNKNKVRVHSKTDSARDSTHGSYITYVNLYLHPNASTTSTTPTTPTTPNEQGVVKKSLGNAKPKCSSKDCHYYDPMCGDDYYCCNPTCSCFDPFYFDPFYFDY